MESKKKMLFIFNPFSGKAQIKSKLFEIIDVFVKGGYEVIVHPTQAVGDGFEKTKELATERCGWRRPPERRGPARAVPGARPPPAPPAGTRWSKGTPCGGSPRSSACPWRPWLP